MCKKRIHRRDFLKSVGTGVVAAAAFDPIVIMLEQIIGNARYTAEAATVSATNLRRFVMVRMNGAPSRWGFDLLLNPYTPDSSLYANNYVKNRITATGDLKYETISYAGLNLPYAWSQMIPTPSGTTKMTSLIDNALFIRGIAMPDDSHNSNQDRLLSPAQSEPSIPTLIQKNSSQFVTNPNLSNSITSILSTLTTSGGNFLYRNKPEYSTVQGAIQAAVQAIGAQMKAASFSNSVIYDNFKSLDSDLNANFFSKIDSLTAEFNAAKLKYQGLLDAAKNQNKFPFPGHTVKTRIAPKANWCQISDPAITRFTSSDLGSIVGQSAAGVDDFGYANQFAATEVLMRAGLTKFCNIISTGVNHMTYESFLDGSTPAQHQGWGWDEHGASPGSIFVVQAYHFRALSACLYELINQFKAAGIFNDSVIMVGAEFGRHGQNTVDGNGDASFADCSHQGYGNSFTFFSGMVQSPICLGNIQSFNFTYFGNQLNSSPADAQSNRGTTGWPAPLDMGGKVDVLSFKEFSTTVTEMIGVPSLFSNFSPIVKVENGKFVPMVAAAKNVAPA